VVAVAALHRAATGEGVEVVSGKRPAPMPSLERFATRFWRMFSTRSRSMGSSSEPPKCRSSSSLAPPALASLASEEGCV
jgi:hypothetical protein